MVLRRVVDFYHATLKESGDAAAYLGSRGIERRGAGGDVQMGFANRTLGYRLPPKQVKAGAAVRSQLQRLGVMRESGHEHFTGSIVVPIFDEQGAVVEMYGREDHARASARHAASHVPARTASRRFQPAGAEGVEGHHPVRGADRCDDVLVCGVSQRDHVVRRGGLHAGAARGPRRVRHRAWC